MIQNFGVSVKRMLLIFCCCLAAIWIDVERAAAAANTSIDTLKRNNPKCTEKRFHQIEVSIARLTGFGPIGRRIPESIEKLPDFCKESNQQLSKTHAFIKECLTKDVGDLFSIVLFSIKRSLRQYCGKNKIPKRVNNLLRLSSCLNQHFFADDRCIQKFLNSTAPLIMIDNDKLKIPHTCCNYVNTLECFERMVDEKQCLKRDRERIMEVIRGTFSGVSNIMCGEYNDQTDKCVTLGAAPVPAKPNTRKYITASFLLIDLLHSIR